MTNFRTQGNSQFLGGPWDGQIKTLEVTDGGNKLRVDEGVWHGTYVHEPLSSAWVWQQD